MALSARQSLILSHIEVSLSAQSLLQNVFLVSRVGPRNRIALSALAALPPLLRLNATAWEILECCARSRRLDVAQEPAGFAVCPRFAVCPSVLIVSGVAKAVRDFHAFVCAMNGSERFQAFHCGDGVALHFEQSDECIALWRALRIVPFRGQWVTAYAHSMALQEQPPAAPERPRAILVEHRKRERPVVAIGRAARPAEVGGL
jgi:hypothetical protein